MVAEEVKRNMQLVTLPEVWKERFLAKVEVWEAEDGAVKQAQLERSRAEWRAVKAKIDRLNDGFTDGSIDVAEFKELKNPLVPKKVELEAQSLSWRRPRQIGLNPSETGF